MVDISLILNQLLGTDCLLCQGRLNTENDTAPFCRHCWSSLPWLGPHCYRCALPMPDTDALECGHCQQQAPPWDQAHALFQYHEPLRSLIQQCKYRHHFYIAARLGRLWARHLQQSSMLDNVDVLVPVPLHWRRQWQRGYNQVMELLRPAGKTLDIPIQPHWLHRIQYTESQTGMNRKARMNNLRHAFHCPDGDVKGKRVMLVDDVMTTGATLQAAATCLLEAGARQVDVMVLARTER